MSNFRPTAVAGSFYPQDAPILSQTVQQLLTQVPDKPSKLSKPEAIIVPHAGYIYSGLTAAYAYKVIYPFRQQIKRVIILGPSHHIALQGMALPSTDSFDTPLGQITLDIEEIAQLSQLEQINISDLAHEKEHSLEVQLPFLQIVLDDFKLIPIVVGQTPMELTSQIIQRYINNPTDLVIISTDLSHFLNYEQAQIKDNNTAENIMNKQIDGLDYSDACGYMPLIGLLHCCQFTALDLQLFDQRNSGDTAGSKQRVVGYGSWGVYTHDLCLFEVRSIVQTSLC